GSGGVGQGEPGTIKFRRPPMLFMVIDGFKPGRQDAMAERFRTKGRLMPEGVAYHGSWLPLDGSRCFQIMESPTRALLGQWVAAWSDLVDFEVEEVLESAEYWKWKKEGVGG
ncbi:MAG: DUF3303 domain-containing protein, partial [Phycisphaerae bacterium]